MLKLKDFFYLQRNDRQAILVLLGVVIVCVSLVIIVGKNNTLPDDANSNGAPIYSSKAKGGTFSHKPIYYKVEGIPHKLFPFDPNTADSTQLLKLGLQAWQVRSIYRYRAKGGIFREPADFARLYGLTKKQYEALAPYIQISEDYRPAAEYYGNKREYRGNNDQTTAYHEADSHEADSHEKVYSYPHKLKAGQHISVNSADTTELMKVPGIGSYYAKTIVRKREQLGGFASISQLKEIDGLPESALSFFTANPQEVKKMDINKLTLNQLRRHPYLNFYQAKEICDYRRLKGPIKSLDDLKLLKDFPPDEIERLKPYITF